MNKPTSLSSGALMTLFISIIMFPPAYGDENEEYTNPGLSAYIAEKGELPPPPKLEFPFPEGIYFSVTGGAGKINNLRVRTQAGDPFQEKTDKKHLTVGGASIGYLFREAGWFNQVDIQYLNWGSFNTTSEGIFGLKVRHHHCRPNVFPCERVTTTSIRPTRGIVSSHIRTQSGMAKLYSTLYIDHRIYPYVFAGIGVYHNNAPAVLTFANETVFSKVPPNTRRTDHKNKRSRTGAAGSVGLGMRFRLLPYIMLDVNYEYSYLGKLPNWNFFRDEIPESTHISIEPVASIRGFNLRGQTLKISLLYQPWAYSAEIE